MEPLRFQPYIRRGRYARSAYWRRDVDQGDDASPARTYHEACERSGRYSLSGRPGGMGMRIMRPPFWVVMGVSCGVGEDTLGAGSD